MCEFGVAENQKEFVASSTFSLAQSKYKPGCMPFCIYNDDIMIEFVMYFIDRDENSRETFWICRFMIDERYQGRDYGKASMAGIIGYAKNNFSFNEI